MLQRFSFGDSPAMADALLALVLSGAKTATCWAACDGDQGVIVGGRMVACDGMGRAGAVLETTALELRRFDHVDAKFAFDEGEGDRSLQHWQDVHRAYFERHGGFDPAMPLWCERFTLVQILLL